MPYQRALPFGALADGDAQRVVVAGQAILVSRIDGVPHAVTDVCPHNGASLAEGTLKDGCVTCPAHLWRFSVVDGRRQGRPDVRIAVFPCRMTDDGWVEVDVPEQVAPTSLREALLAHARQGPVR
ncbi:MAG TPA: nitrite reductase [Actinobacteria bacterium]|nr:nitrite reductase [Actinomycetota bacterium]